IDALSEMAVVAQEAGALGFVYPWTSPRPEDGDLRPAFYPLIGLDRGRLEELRATVLGPR
ncbi:MAG: hypothetical protein R3291_05415, partial [Thermoplasmata archaeon]|nr:hypothetical protein [Thermoplasmata archaeon]